LGNVPILIGEVGIPFDVNDSLNKTPGDYRVQIALLDALVSALERNWAAFTLWNYNPSNSVAHGDIWNMEDFSIVNMEPHAQDSRNRRVHEQEYSGGRALEGILRPYACKVAGIPLSTSWDRHTRKFTFSWKSTELPSSSKMSQVTEIFVPEYLYDDDSRPVITVKNGKYDFHPADQTLYVESLNSGINSIHSVTIRVPSSGPLHSSMMMCLALLMPLLALLITMWYK
jgi:hypothetical protein FG02690.1